MKTFIIALLVVLILGAGLGYAMAIKTQHAGQTNVTINALTPQTAVDSKAADLRAALNAVARQHAELVADAARSVFDTAPDFPAATAALETNAESLAAAAGDAYGSTAQQQFLPAWKNFNGALLDYIQTSKRGDPAGMDRARASLTDMAARTGDALVAYNPDAQKDAVMLSANQYAKLVLATIDAYSAKDYAGSYHDLQQAEDQAGKIADTLAAALVRQFPDRYR